MMLRSSYIPNAGAKPSNTGKHRSSVATVEEKSVVGQVKRPLSRNASARVSSLPMPIPRTTTAGSGNFVAAAGRSKDFSAKQKGQTAALIIGKPNEARRTSARLANVAYNCNNKRVTMSTATVEYNNNNVTGQPNKNARLAAGGNITTIESDAKLAKREPLADISNKVFFAASSHHRLSGILDLSSSDMSVGEEVIEGTSTFFGEGDVTVQLRVSPFLPKHEITSALLDIPIPKPLSSLSPNYGALRRASIPRLPAGVRDVDARAAAQDGLHCKDTAQGIMAHMRQLERSRLSVFSTKQSASHKTIARPMRAMLMDWLLIVQHHFGLQQTTFYVAVSLADRFVHKNETAQEKYQLVGITSLFIASKMEERYPVEIEKLVELTDGACEYDDVILMERSMLVGLSFVLTAATPDFFLCRFAMCANILHDKMVLDLSSYFCDLLVPQHIWLECLPSKIAAAALCLTGTVTNAFEWDMTMEFYTGYAKRELNSIMHFMAFQTVNAEKFRLEGAHKKYSSISSYDGIAKNAALTSENQTILAYAAKNCYPVLVLSK